MAKTTYIKGVRYYSGSEALSDYIFISEESNFVDIIIVRQWGANEFIWYPWCEQPVWAIYTELQLIRRDVFENKLKNATYYLDFFEVRQKIEEDLKLLKRHRLLNINVPNNLPEITEELCNE